MMITVDATFENGTFKPIQPVELPEGAKVRLSVAPEGATQAFLSSEEQDALMARGRELVRRTRERNRNVPADVIRREIEQAIDEVCGRTGR